MPLLKGEFDPNLLNAIVLSQYLRLGLKRQIENGYKIDLLDLAQNILDQLLSAKIIR